MGKRTLENSTGERKLNLVKVFIVIILIVLVILGIYFLIKSINKNETSSNVDDNEVKNKIIGEEKNENTNDNTIDEIVAEFGGTILEQVKNDTYYVSKDGTDYTVYLDGEIIPGRIVPWNGEEAKPAIDEAGNINIYTAAELAWVARQVANGEKNFSGVTITLRDNIDLGARENEDGSWDGTNWNSIIGFLDTSPSKNAEGTQNTEINDESTITTNENLKRFAGVFNGNGYIIRGMKIDNNERYQGLFGYVSGTVSDLTIKNSFIRAREGVGAITGLNEGRIVNCKVEKTIIKGTEKIGGLIGIAMTNSYIENCQTLKEVTVSADENIGGIVGYANNNASILNCVNNANLTGTNYVGGISGIVFYGSEIKECLNNSSAISGGNYVGGLVGYSQAQIEKSSSTGTIIGKNYVGGLVGLNYVMGNITNSFNDAKITVSEDNGGGIVGLNNATIANCYNSGEIDCSKATGLRIGGICGQNLSESFIYTSYNIGKIKNENYAGGLVGADFGTISNSFWLDTCLENENAETDYKFSETEMKEKMSSDLGEYFKTDDLNINSGYPILIWQ